LSGIYLHIPFCKKACHYCDFHFSTVLGNKSQLIAAMLKEIKLRADFLSAPVDTIYFGGGTPSLLEQFEVGQILDEICKYHAISPSAEITLEANPDDLSMEKLKSLESAGINRLSIGIQSFRQEDLELMNRAHSALEARQCIDRAQEAGFSNISIDLIYGIPNLNSAAWKNNLQVALHLNIQHISAYCLTIEKKTVFDNWQKSERITLPGDEVMLEQFTQMKTILEEHGFEHYEISNFGKPDFFSRHNSAYWFQKPYLGIGPSAHSFKGNIRSWNIANNPGYIKAIETGNPFSKQENLSSKDQFNELLLTRLRTKWGVSKMELRDIGGSLYEEFKVNSDSWINKGMLTDTGSHLILAKQGVFIADAVISDMFVI